jgi:hypothetical protein
MAAMRQGIGLYKHIVFRKHGILVFQTVIMFSWLCVTSESDMTATYHYDHHNSLTLCKEQVTLTQNISENFWWGKCQRFPALIDILNELERHISDDVFHTYWLFIWPEQKIFSGYTNGLKTKLSEEMFDISTDRTLKDKCKSSSDYLFGWPEGRIISYFNPIIYCLVLRNSTTK